MLVCTSTQPLSWLPQSRHIPAQPNARYPTPSPSQIPHPNRRQGDASRRAFRRTHDLRQHNQGPTTGPRTHLRVRRAPPARALALLPRAPEQPAPRRVLVLLVLVVVLRRVLQPRVLLQQAAQAAQRQQPALQVQTSSGLGAEHAALREGNMGMDAQARLSW